MRRDRAERSVLKPQFPIRTKNVNGVRINCIESRYVGIDLLPVGWDRDAERSVLKPQISIKTKNVNGVRINCIERRYGLIGEPIVYRRRAIKPAAAFACSCRKARAQATNLTHCRARVCPRFREIGICFCQRSV